MPVFYVFWWTEEHAKLYRALIQVSFFEIWLGAYQDLTLAAAQRYFKSE